MDQLVLIFVKEYHFAFFSFVPGNSMDLLIAVNLINFATEIIFSYFAHSTFF